PPGVARRKDQLAHAVPPLVESSRQLIQLPVFVVVPLRWNAPCKLSELRAAQPLFYARQPRLEGIHSSDVPVDAVPIIKPAQRRVRKIPLPGVEAEPLVDEHGLIARTARLQKKDGLPPVRIAGPLVEYQHPRELGEILHLLELFVRQKIVHRQLRRIAGISRAELPPGAARRPPNSQLHHQLRRKLDEFAADLHHLHLRNPQTQTTRYLRAKHFVGQNPNVLRIVLEFDDV